MSNDHLKAPLDWPASGTETEFPTFGEASTFDAKFLAGGKISLRFGGFNRQGRRNGYRALESGYLDRLAGYFSGRLVAPTSNDKEAESIDGWIVASGITTRLSSYVCTLLVELGYANREGDQLRFR
jgi:hypothetical protein